MRLRELIFQGLLGASSPSRLRPGTSLTRMALPKDLTVKQVHDLMVACLYPTHLTDSCRQRLGFDDGAKLAAVLETESGVFRVVRRNDAASVRLQAEKNGGYRDVATGASTVEDTLCEKLSLPDVDVFFALHLWRFDPDELPRADDGAQFGDHPQIPEVVEQYRLSLQIEELEDEINEIEGRIEQGQKALGKGTKIKEKLEQARQKLDDIAVDELSQEDIDLLESKDERLAEFDDELTRLHEQADRELDAIEELVPDAPTQRPVLWFGIVVAVSSLLASFVLYQSYRIVALGSIPGFVIAGIELLRYYSDRGRAEVHKVRLKSIRRRINQVREQEVLFRERIDHLLFEAGVDDEAELQRRLPKAAQLRDIIDDLEEKQESVRRDPEYRQARQEIDELEQRLETLQNTREELPSFVMNSFRLESDLEELGVDPLEVRKWLDRQEQGGVDDDREFSDPFEWLRAVAQKTGQWSDGGLLSSTRSTWSKICSHVLGDRFDDLELTPEGRLSVAALNEEQQQMWQNTRSAEVHAVVSALALALHVTDLRRGGPQGLMSLWIAEPGKTMTPGHVDKFESVFKRAAKESQIVICETR